MKILHVMASVNDEGGGPIEALVQADVVGRRLGHSRTIASLDGPDDPWVRRCPVETVALGSPPIKRWRSRVPLLRYGFTPHLVPWLRAEVSSYDRVVVNGLWNYTALAARRVLPFQRVPYFVFTHGMLDPWFRQAHPIKHHFKQASWLAAEGPLLRGASAVLFTCETEKQRADKAFWPYQVNGLVAGYGTGDVPHGAADQRAAFHAAVPGLNGRPYLLFLSRLHPKKGCDLLLRAFAAQRERLAGYDLVMAGPDSDGWRPALKVLARDLGLGNRIHWPGMLRAAEKWGALRECEAFVLPSHGENFGLAVAEAMACGRPVLISDKVNIASDIVEAGAGLAEPDTQAGVSLLLNRFTALSSAAKAQMATRARGCFLDRFLVDRVGERTLSILQSPELFA